MKKQIIRHNRERREKAVKIDCLDEKTISDIGRAFAYYDYGAERGLVSAFAQK